MWPFQERVRQRRLEIRRSMPPADPSLWRRFRDAGGIGGVLVAAGFYAVVLLLDLWPMDPLPYRLGQYLPADVRARVPFVPPPRAALPEPTAEDTTPASFLLNEEADRRLYGDLQALPNELAEAATSRPASMPTTAESRPASRPSVEVVLGSGGREEYDRRVEALMGQLRKLFILKPEDARRQIDRKAGDLYVYGMVSVRASLEKTAILSAGEGPVEQLSSARLQERLADLAKPFDGAVRKAVQAKLEKVFLAEKTPLYLYDKDRTEKRTVKRTFDPGDVLALASRQGDQVEPLTASELELIGAEHAAYKAEQEKLHPWHLRARMGGRAVVLLGLVAAICAYVFRYDAGIIKDLVQAVRLAAVLAAMLLLGKAITSALQWNPYAVVLVVMMGAMVLAIAYEQRFALALGSFLGVLAAMQLRAPLSLAIVLLTAVAASAFQLREIRTRSKLVTLSGTTAAAVFVMVWANAWFAGTPAEFALADGLWAGGFALLAGFLVQGLLPVIERIFRIATSMTLLEWCDASKPLLRLLAMQAPGTFNHSLQLGAMCEAAAEAIGARGLLARTGAYYHDIGKINKAEYFVENQAGSASKHAKLSPAMSLLIITGHVKDGLELAKEYALPRVLHEFIATHHGTTLVQYFYQAAAEQRKSSQDTAPDEMEFRYPGPKPRSREAAILMLADAAESSVRSMADPTPGRIENQVHAMVSRRLMDAQLDECDLTLKQVHAIEASLVRSLCGMYHSRVTYPTPAGERPSAAERPQARPAGAK